MPPEREGRLDETTAPRGQSPRAVALSVVRVMITAGAPTAVKVGTQYCPPLTLLTVRFLLAFAIAYVMARVAGSPPWPSTRDGWTRAIVFSLAQVLMPAVLLYLAMPHSSAGMGAIVYATQPLVLALIAHGVLDERLTAQRVLGLVLGFGGVIVVMVARIGMGQSDSLLGTALNLGSVASLTLGALVFKRFTPPGSNIGLLSVQHAISSLFLIPLVFLLEDPGNVTITASLTWSIVYSLVFSSLIGPLIWQYMLRTGEASVFTSYYFLTPILGLLFAALFVGEAFTPRDAVGLASTVIGIILVARSPAKVLGPVAGRRRGAPRAA